MNFSFVRFYVTLLFALAFGSSYGQRESSIWYFGKNAGISFLAEPPVALSDGAMVTTEGCSTISSPGGDLLFYTDGITVYNRDHDIMQNGEGLSGNSSSTQSGVIVPIPENPDLYYVFTVSNLDVGSSMDGFRYSQVNMQMAGGNGAIVPSQKNVPLFAPTTERITSVRNYEGNGIWVIGHRWESNRFVAYQVTMDGIDTSDPVFSDVGEYHGNDNRLGKGYMKASSAGDRIAVAITGLGVVQVFDFDNATGEITNPITLPAGEDPYGVEFSEDARLLYADERSGVNLYQWDLEAGDENEVINSRQLVGVFEVMFGGALQMAPNGKIYIAHKSENYLSVIHAPENLGTACDFEYAAFDLCEDCLSKEGLPSFIQSYFGAVWIEYSGMCANDTVFFELSDTSSVQSVAWDFGDPLSGASNTSQLLFPWHIYHEAGTYNISATYVQANAKQVTETVEINPLPDVNLGDDRFICEGDSVVFDSGEGFDTYQWMDNSDYNSPFYSAFEEGDYLVRVTDICGIDYDTVFLGVYELPAIDLGKDTIIMYGTTIILDPGNGFSGYLWQDGSNLPEYVLDYPGTYWVEVKDDEGCKTSDTIYIEAIPFSIHVPTAFSPNGDGINDTFKAIASYEADIEFRMSVYDRWGERVFKSRRIDDGWDGTYKDLPCPMEVYTWVIDASGFEENEFFSGDSKMMGNVTLLR